MLSPLHQFYFRFLTILDYASEQQYLKKDLLPIEGIFYLLNARSLIKLSGPDSYIYIY